MKLVVFSLSLLISISSFAAEKSISTIHREMCALASEYYPVDMPSTAACVENTDIELGDEFFSISFTACSQSLWVTIDYDRVTGEILEGSSGLDDGMCE